MYICHYKTRPWDRLLFFKSNDAPLRIVSTRANKPQAISNSPHYISLTRNERLCWCGNFQHCNIMVFTQAFSIFIVVCNTCCITVTSHFNKNECILKIYLSLWNFYIRLDIVLMEGLVSRSLISWPWKSSFQDDEGWPPAWPYRGLSWLG